jgi:REP element-mobilizing transposase RayT
MRKRIDKFSRTAGEIFKGKHRFEHWYVDNQVYFITARCRGRADAFAGEPAKALFWDRFDHYAAEAGFAPWVTSLLDNHYHTLGYLRVGLNLKHMMQRLHGSVAKLVNDHLESTGAARLSGPRLGFWSDKRGKDYFDGCIRDVKQCRLAYRYALLQSQRHRVVRDYRTYSHTHVKVDLERGVRRALELGAFMEDVPYKRYEK